MSHLKYWFKAVVILLLIIPFNQLLSAKKIRQVHKIEKTEKGKKKISGNKKSKSGERIICHNTYVINTNDSTSLIFEADSIKFTGYDKPASASKESFHIINSSEMDINKVGIRITYLDLKGRMLHSRDEVVTCHIPSGQTRLVTIPTWDVQHTFFYHLGPEPGKVATPYNVAIDLLWVEL